MPKYKSKILLITILITLTTTLSTTPPRLTVMIVVDQFAHSYLEKLDPFLRGGIRKLLDNGVVYNNAYMPHAQPSTSTGHTALGTGCYACEHGIIGNSWRTLKNKKYKCIYDKIYGKSAHNIMVDCFADQFMLASQPNAQHQAFSLSFKGRAAIGMGGNLAKVFWFDEKQKQFTTSKAYLDKIPNWVKTFNKKHHVSDVPPTLLWKLFYPLDPLPYNFAQINDYRFTRYPFSLIDIPFKDLKNKTDLSLEELFIKTPQANQYLLDFALACLHANISSQSNDKTFLALSLSPLDPLGHYYGPASKEVTDMIYHLDWQLDYFMDQIKKIVPEEDVLFVLTADHGVEPIIELVQEKGDKQAHRIHQATIVKDLNNFAKQEFNLDSLVVAFHSPQFFLNRKLFYEQPLKKQRKILRKLKHFLEKVPGIKQVWTATQVVTRNFDPQSINQYYQNQFYKRRSGELTCKIEPYCAITKHPRGTHHKTPYEPNTHIPLVLYKKEEIEKKKVNEIVYALQLPNTLAHICNVNKPSASTCYILPEIQREKKH